MIERSLTSSSAWFRYIEETKKAHDNVRALREALVVGDVLAMSPPETRLDSRRLKAILLRAKADYEAEHGAALKPNRALSVAGYLPPLSNDFINHCKPEVREYWEANKHKTTTNNTRDKDG